MPKGKKSDPKTYTKPDLRDHIKEEVVASDKGGNPGQWSARKAQLVTQEYEREGGSYKKDRNAAQKNLKEWGEEHWTTADGKQARRSGGTARYLPEKAWKKLSPQEKKATDEQKRAGSRSGKQFVANPAKAASARKQASKETVARKKQANTQARSGAKKMTGAAAKRAVTTKRPAASKKSTTKKAATKKRAAR
jgi:hypothetical protein